MEAMTSGPRQSESLQAAPESIPNTVAAGSEGPPSPDVTWGALEAKWGVGEVAKMTTLAREKVQGCFDGSEYAPPSLHVPESVQPPASPESNQPVGQEEPAPQPGRRKGTLGRMFSRKPQTGGSQLDWSAMKRFEETPPVIEADKPYANESHATLPNSKPGFVRRAVARLSRGAMPKGRRR